MKEGENKPKEISGSEKKKQLKAYLKVKDEALKKHTSQVSDINNLRQSAKLFGEAINQPEIADVVSALTNHLSLAQNVTPEVLAEIKQNIPSISVRTCRKKKSSSSAFDISNSCNQFIYNIGAHLGKK